MPKSSNKGQDSGSFPEPGKINPTQPLTLKPKQLSELTGIPIGTLSRWRCSGRGPRSIKRYGTVLYYLSDVLAYIEGGVVPSVRASVEGSNVAQKTR